MKDTHIFFIFVVAVLLASCALMVYYRAEGFTATAGQALTINTNGVMQHQPMM